MTNDTKPKATPDSIAYREAAKMALDKAACQSSTAAFHALLAFADELNAKATLCEMQEQN